MSLKASISQLYWNGASKSFDNTEIQMTRPGFGMIVLITPNQIAHHLRDQVSKHLLLRTRDQTMHVTIFQVFLMFDKDYDPKTLPMNLLKVLQDYMSEQLENEVAQVARDITEKTVEMTDEWIILGKDMPTHLAIRVSCKQVDEFLFDLKHKVNELGHAWMSVLAEELQQRNAGGEIKINPTGVMVHGKGWSLILGYTANEDFKTHITLGILASGDSELDELLILQHQNVERIIEPTFSSENGDIQLRDNEVRYRESVRRVQINRLMKLCEQDITLHPNLTEQVTRVKQGKNIIINKLVIDEWGRYLLATLSDLTSLYINNRTLRISGIQHDVINMDRLQNFEL